MKLTDITDAHVRALLDLGSNDDFAHMHAVDVLQGFGWKEADAQRIKAEAQRIAEGLSDEQARHLEPDCEPIFSPVADAMDALGLVKVVYHHIWRVLPTPAGRLVAALRERNQLEREAGSRLPDSDTRCERWESEKDER